MKCCRPAIRPPRLMGGPAVIVIGVDAHKATHTVVCVNRATGEQLGELTAAANEDGHLALLRFGERHGGDGQVWAIEDCRHVSGALERFLLKSGETVLRVPPKMMAGERKTARSYGKSDSI